ncbi:chromosome partitioning protein [Bathymodiolus japonicus methanotrophic gill symbiont]|uniref:ParA family partition ATPase n=1 Tax=Bathymodiolus japonicus methanotrophic gill symbiont TaxID=113269 RepID=UPI001B609E96|nr:ParA family partition ATPase [Bathymodiolus japonicus methanotrophic gill symbiont]GFO73480.1 chromosome partitioning protein [Bathymodiolus japonicus methanotrophic gill symbiont]
MTKIIAILNQKGGAGKTTLSTNIARSLQLDECEVLLVDSDPQGSARDWNAAGDGALVPVIGLDRSTLAKDIQSVKSGKDFIIIDGAPQIAELAVAAIKCSDLILIPVQPSPYDVWACDDLVDVIKARQDVTDGKPLAAFIISRAIKNTNLSKEVGEALEGYGLPVFKTFTSQKIIYAKSAATGSTVLDFENGNNSAEKEIISIKNEILEFLK